MLLWRVPLLLRGVALLRISLLHLVEIKVGKVIREGNIGHRHLLWGPVGLEDRRHLIHMNNRENNLHKPLVTTGILAPTLSEQH